MFIRYKVFQDMRDDVIKAQAIAAAQLQVNVVLEANMNWFRHRLTQVEAERAQLIHHTLGVKIPTPEFQAQQVQDEVQRFMDDHKFKESDIFHSMSDDEALAEGVTWDNEGRVVHK